MIDHVGIYRSRVAEGLSASNVGLVIKMMYGIFIIYFDHLAVGHQTIIWTSSNYLLIESQKTSPVKYESQ